ncbi:MAG: hypothetical protein ACPGYV_04810, partial [Phycisphaeraceae bacterium]
VAVTATRLLRTIGYPPVGAVLDAACDALPAMFRQPGGAALLGHNRGLLGLVGDPTEATVAEATAASFWAQAVAVAEHRLIDKRGELGKVVGHDGCERVGRYR